MRQANIVGSSPLSGPSRLIQTLQAAPDTPPSNLTLLAATQTSLRVRWKVGYLTHTRALGHARTCGRKKGSQLCLIVDCIDFNPRQVQILNFQSAALCTSVFYEAIHSTSERADWIQFLGQKNKLITLF